MASSAFHEWATVHSDASSAEALSAAGGVAPSRYSGPLREGVPLGEADQAVRGGRANMKIGDLKTGDRIRVRWYPGHMGVEGVVQVVVQHAAPAAGAAKPTIEGRI